MVKRSDFEGDNGYIVMTFDADGARLRPVHAGAPLTAAEVLALLGDILQPEPSPAPEIVALSQRDPRWKDEPLGFSNLTLGGFGCAVTAVTMLASRVDPGVTPSEMNAWLRARNAFVGANIVWERVPAAFPALQFVKRIDWDRRLTAEEVASIGQVLGQYGPQVLEVDFNPQTQKQEQHFVVALRRVGDDLEIIDTWDGQRHMFLERYGDEDGDGVPDQDLARATWGLRVYRVAED